MEVLGKAFCPACTESHIEKIHSLVKPYNSYTPANSSTLSISNTDLRFSVNGIIPTPKTVKIEWLLNGKSVKNNNPTYTLQTISVTGTNQLQAKVIDTTALVRIATHFTQHVYLITWNIQKTATGIGINSSETEISYMLSGNPITDNSFLKYYLNDNAHIQLNLVDMNGKVQTLEGKFRSKGSYTISLNPESYKVASGIYLLSMMKES